MASFDSFLIFLGMFFCVSMFVVLIEGALIGFCFALHTTLTILLIFIFGLVATVWKTCTYLFSKIFPGHYNGY